MWGTVRATGRVTNTFQAADRAGRASLRTGPRRPFAVHTTALLLLVACSLAGCRSSTPEVREVRIGLIAPITGDLAYLGQATVEAAKLAEREANDQGGLVVGGQKYRLNLIIEDDTDSQEVAVRVAKKLINLDDVAVIVGPQLSRDAIPAANVAERSRIPMISPASTNPQTTAGKSYVYRAAFIDPFQGSVMARFAHEDLHASRTAVLFDVASAYNRGIAESFRKAYEDLGGTIVAYETYTTGETDFHSQWEHIAASNPDVVYLPNYDYEIVPQVQQAKAMGLNFQYIGADAWGALPPNMREQLNGGYFTTHYAPDIGGAEAQHFFSSYTKAYGDAPIDLAALTYDAFHLLFQAMADERRTTPEAIRAGLAGIRHFTGVTGTFEYRGTGDPVKSAAVVEIVGGKFVYHKSVAP